MDAMAMAVPHLRPLPRFAACRRAAIVGYAPIARFRLMPERETPEALLCRVAQAQDRGAFQVLFLHFAPRIKSYLLRTGASSQQAEELAQEAMLTVWRKAALFDPARASAATWIFTIARNLRIDLIRRERHPGFDPADPGLLPEESIPADTGMETRQEAQAVQAAMRDLPPEQAEVIALFFYGDKPHSEIAAALDIPLGTVKSRLRLAMARLRQRLGDKS
jgi:RNA polymerase sigma factor (sigma-70 family)